MPRFSVLGQYLFTEFARQLDQYRALLDEDQELRTAEYDVPDPARRRLRIACNTCDAPACCNQLVSVELVEAMVLYRWAAEHAPQQLARMIARGQAQAAGKPVDDVTFFRRKVPCGFLVNGRCSVYAVRPHGCRTHYMGGQPRKCREELAPSETFAMDPDPVLNEEMKAVAADVRFFAQVEDVGPHELSEVLALIDGLADEPRWDAPRRLGEPRIAEEPKSR